jgi:hypothetical protein
MPTGDLNSLSDKFLDSTEKAIQSSPEWEQDSGQRAQERDKKYNTNASNRCNANENAGVKLRRPLAEVVKEVQQVWSEEYKRDAERGDVNAQVVVASMYLDGGFGKIKKSRHLGKYWLSEAIMQHSIEANQLWRYHFAGDDETIDSAKRKTPSISQAAFGTEVAANIGCIKTTTEPLHSTGRGRTKTTANSTPPSQLRTQLRSNERAKGFQWLINLLNSSVPTQPEPELESKPEPEPEPEPEPGLLASKHLSRCETAVLS